MTVCLGMLATTYCAAIKVLIHCLAVMVMIRLKTRLMQKMSIPPKEERGMISSLFTVTPVVAQVTMLFMLISQMTLSR